MASMRSSSSSSMMQNVARRLLQPARSMNHHHQVHFTSSSGCLSVPLLQYNTLFNASQQCTSVIHLPTTTGVTSNTIKNLTNYHQTQARSFSTNFERKESSSFSSFQQDDDNDNDLSNMSNQELQDTSTIPGWDLIHCPPRTFPRGALVGTVVSDKMQKTINVAVNRYRIVPKIRKRQRYTRKFMAHDEKEVANIGDLVMITPCQKLSRHKHFMLREIIRPKGQL